MSENLKIFNFSEIADIQMAKDYHHKLRAHLESGQNTILNLAHVKKVDASLIQLVLAAKLKSRSLGIRCQISQSVSGEFAELAWLCGIIDSPQREGKLMDAAFDAYLGGGI